MTKVGYYIFDHYTTYNCRPVELLGGSGKVYILIMCSDMIDINCRQFSCYCCIGFDWVNIFRSAMGWVGFGQSVDGFGRVGSPKMDLQTTLT